MEKIEIKYTDSIESRMDRYLNSIFSSLTNGLVNKYIRKKYILLNGKKTESSYRVKKHDIVTVPLFFNDLYKGDVEPTYHSGPAINLADKLLDEYLIFSNDDFIVINKPTKLPTQGGVEISLSIDHALSYLNKESKEYRIVHRLDKDTSGLLIIASNKDGARILTKAFKDKLIYKEYKAILYGKLSHNSGWIVDGEYRKDFSPETDIKYDTITKFEVLAHNSGFYYVKFNPVTGKKHQLRIDSASLGAPVVGDEKHDSYKYSNLMLHAEKLLISSSVFGEEFNFDVKMPRHFINFLTDRKLIKSS